MPSVGLTAHSIRLSCKPANGSEILTFSGLSLLDDERADILITELGGNCFGGKLVTERQTYQLSLAGPSSPSDEIIVSKCANPTRMASLRNLPYVAGNLSAVDRNVQSWRDEFVSVLDFGAKGDGVTDDTTAIQAAANSELRLCFPPGKYRLTAPVSVRPGRTIAGSGREVTEIIAKGALAFIFQRNEGANKIDNTAAEDWNCSSIQDMAFRMSTGGIRAIGHEFRAARLNFYGGSSASQADLDGWCIDMVDANECRISTINAGHVGGVDHILSANGIRWRAATPGANYGDSLIDETSIKLGAANTVAVLIDGHGADPAKVIHNMVLQRIQVNAPQTDSGITPLCGSNGIKLWNASRICLIDCDVEVLETAFEEFSERVGGVAGACVANTFIGCNARYSTTNYRDSNSTFAGSVIQPNFVGCENVAPLAAGIFDGKNCTARTVAPFSKHLDIQ